MARPEQPVDHTVPELGRFAEHLRSMRHAAHLTYRDLASHTSCSAATLKRAASGKSLPSPAVATQYALGCVIVSNDLDAARAASRLRKEAAEAVAEARRRSRRSTVLPKPQFARDEGDLSGALRDAWRRAGEPSFRAMERAAGHHGALPRSTAHAMAKGRTLPREFLQYVLFLEACGISGSDLAPWLRAWSKICGYPTWAALATASRRLKNPTGLTCWDAFLRDIDDRAAALAEIQGIVKRVITPPVAAMKGDKPVVTDTAARFAARRDRPAQRRTGCAA
ncbi:helix-turn-helix domain-containing protein [Streptomyces sp. 5-8]|uniref:Helix-turn-helix domain-containing protein n=1 Tax=Streptomyces musisoli TaxID=2802280 RepID=A0ABS1PBL9_9ACTN|nr:MULTISPECIES: helix-turn-helix transcriptional regulator [Streptomyces]MBL1109748.1 helix-turn-helix domain-containing protein [Streptomyces musisoli]MBY8847107.1 helix-turn-helix domain-containing protein [Streptomyces sp. SP2-10]